MGQYGVLKMQYIASYLADAFIQRNYIRTLFLLPRQLTESSIQAPASTF